MLVVKQGPAARSESGRPYYPAINAEACAGQKPRPRNGGEEKGGHEFTFDHALFRRPRNCERYA